MTWRLLPILHDIRTPTAVDSNHGGDEYNFHIDGSVRTTLATSAPALLLPSTRHAANATPSHNRVKRDYECVFKA